ncbi:MAG: bifunctional riboflavin kinase/FAD synthetase [Actinomycetes bacterium]
MSDEDNGSRRVQRWNDLSEVPRGYGPSVVAIGNFDGVHRGHVAVLSRLVAEARGRRARAVAITFDPHPLQVLRPEHAPAQLVGNEHKVALLAETGLDGVLVLPFTLELASWSPERFVEDVLVRALDSTAVVVGRDIRFGHRNAGDLSTMQRLGEQHGFDVVVLDDVTGPGSGAEPGQARRWSSSWTRELLAAGDVAAAAEVLGRLHRVSGRVVHGDHRGRELGYPTANLGQQMQGMVPADGVYAGWLVRLDRPEEDPDRHLPAAISIGTNPTFDGRQRRVEAYVLDRTDLELYGETIALDLVEYLRETLRFDDIDTLKQQMAKDVERCHEVLDTVPPGVPVT